ncbi:hypothetical protein Peur_060359 [Populus x canadensis]
MTCESEKKKPHQQRDVSQKQAQNSIEKERGEGLRSCRSRISYTSLSSNGLINQILSFISNLQNLWHLNLSRNELSNPLPVIQGRGLPRLLSKDLTYNNLSLGSVLDWIKDKELSEIKLPDVISSVELKSNQLSGFLSRILNNRTNNFQEILNVSDFRHNPETY